MVKHLYAHGGKAKNLQKFKERYGKIRGAQIYGKVVGKVRRQRMALGLCSARGCAAPATHKHGKHGCCGSVSHHLSMNIAHAVFGEDNVF